MEDFITLKQLQAYDKLKVPGVIFVEELPENPENAIYGIKHEDKETVEYTTKFIDILATYFTEYTSGKFTIREDYEAEVDGTEFKSAALVSGKYFIYSEEECQGLLPGDYSPYNNYTFSISEDIVHTDFYTGKAEDKTYVKLANVDEVERYFIRKEQKGKANGVASLDSNGRVPVEQMPVQAFVYLGQWDASTGVFPPDADTPGDFYEVNVAGTIEGIEFLVGDWIVWTTSGWDKSENKNYVNSVNKKRGEVEVYGDNTEIETPSDTEETDTRTIKQYIDDITVDGNTWDEDTQNITSKAVNEVDELPTDIEDKVYNVATKIPAFVDFPTSISSVLDLIESYERGGDPRFDVYYDIVWKDGVEIYLKGERFIPSTIMADSIYWRQMFNETQSTWNASEVKLADYKDSAIVYSKSIKLVTDDEWSADKENIAYKDKENVFTETNTFDTIKAHSIGKDNTEITFEGDTVDVTGDLQVKCIKEPEAIEIETPALTQNGKYLVVDVDGNEADNNGRVESTAVIEVDELPDDPKDKVYIETKEDAEGNEVLKAYAKSTRLATFDELQDADKIRTVDHIEPTEDKNVTTKVELTKAEYDELIMMGADDPNVTYYVTDEQPSADFINDYIVSAGLTWSSRKIRDAIEAATPVIINDAIKALTTTYSSEKIVQLIAQAVTDMLTKTVADATYQPKGNYATTAQISDMETKTNAANTYQPKGDYATSDDISDMLTKTDASDAYQPKGNYATTAQISDMETKTNASNTYQPKGDYATTTQISDMATKTWVGQQGFLKSIPEGIVTEDTFKTELQKYIYRSGNDVIFNL